MPMVDTLPKSKMRVQLPITPPNGPRRAEHTVPRDLHRFGASGKRARRLIGRSASTLAHHLRQVGHRFTLAVASTGVRGLGRSLRDDWFSCCCLLRSARSARSSQAFWTTRSIGLFRTSSRLSPSSILVEDPTIPACKASKGKAL